jgi:hypothetical protein
MPLNYTLKMVKIGNFMLYVSQHTDKKFKETLDSYMKRDFVQLHETLLSILELKTR